MNNERVIIEQTGGIARIILARPEVLNALDRRMWESLVEAVRKVGHDPETRVVILTGAGRAFCAGADLNETAWRNETAEQSRRRIERNNQQLAREMISAPVPIIAAVNGYALGGGLEIALAADFRIASTAARFGFPESSIGRFVSGGASLLLPRAVGMAWARRLIYAGEQIDAETARTIGLVEEVCPPEELIDRAEQLAQVVAANAATSVTLAKKVLNRIALGDLETALAFETEALLATYATEENERGVTAFATRERTTGDEK